MSRPTPHRRLAIVGCGAIGSLVARLLEKKKFSFRVTAVFDTYISSAQKLSRNLKSRPKVCRELKQIFPLCDIVLESASVQAAVQVAEESLKRRKPLVMMSTGGFLLNQKRLTALAQKHQTKIYLPSGAVSGMDGLRAARQMGKISQVTITSRKPPRGFLGAPGLSQTMARKLSQTRKPLVLYNGGVKGAIKAFPANVNVAATTALALDRPEKLRVRVIADPSVSTNQHEIHLSGSFGEMKTLTRNIPSAQNPKTSALAIQAALALLERLASPMEVGS